MADSQAPSSYLSPTYFIDSDSPEIREYAQTLCKGIPSSSIRERAVALYYGVRDDIRYDPYSMSPHREAYRASAVLAQKTGFCIPKAVLLTATLRAQGIPARPGFADVRNHIATKRLLDLMEVDLFLYHGYVEIYLDHRWVKSTPAFNLSLCENFGIKPLEFDGVHDSLFHEFDVAGNRHMEYVRDHGPFEDLPFDRIFAEFRKAYPKIFALNLDHDQFSREAARETREKNTP